MNAVSKSGVLSQKYKTDILNDDNNEVAIKAFKLLKEKFDKKNEFKTVLDLFGGSGSTLIACEQLNRKCYMMELDPHYCDVIINRWETLTGDKATLLESK